jgi:lipoprotein-anchoring transpeptidase ErfK/SrfK
MFRPCTALLGCALFVAPVLQAASPSPNPAPSVLPGRAATLDIFPDSVVVSVKDQKLMVVHDGKRVAIYPVSTSKYGLGDYWGRMTTPLGYLQVAHKIGDNAPVGAVFHNRRFTGEILKPNAPGRDPVITRIIWLRGLEAQNAHAFSRCIYIHGTPEERRIGRPASFGCIRMRSTDVIALYDELHIGMHVTITKKRLIDLVPAEEPSLLARSD